MASQSSGFPSSLPSDPSAVAHAIDIGTGDWKRGDWPSAIRWLHRAAEAAEVAGDEGRAMDLARAAAELVTAFGIELRSPSAPPQDEAAALAPFDDFNDQTIVDSPLVVAARTRPSSAAIPAVPAAEESQVSPIPRAAVPRPHAAKSSPGSAVRPSAPRSSAESAPGVRTALRVAVARDSREQGVLVAHVLGESAPVPAGSDEALLVFLHANARIPSAR